MKETIMQDDPYQLAMQFEKIGQDLYANLAQISESSEARELFARLSKEESAHFEFFQKLRMEITHGSMRMDRQAILNIMRTHILPVPGEVGATALYGNRTKALEMALQMEQNSVLFYRDLASVTLKYAGDIAKIVYEEQRHAQVILNLLKVVENINSQRNIQVAHN